MITSTTSAAARLIKTALIVEDDESLLTALVRFCEERGVKAYGVRSQREAELVLSEDWDLALVDVKLPDGSGLHVCEALCAKMPRPIVVAISGSATAKDGFSLARTGVGEFVEKPFDEADLWKAIEKNAGVPLHVTIPGLVGSISLKDAHRALRRTMLDEALARSETITEAARLLGVSRQAVQQAIDKLKSE